LVVIALVTFVAVSLSAQTGQRRIPWPDEYGNVLLNNYSEEGRIAPVVFNHWLHRSLYTCRLCHVDLGFAMEAGGTGIRQSDLTDGLFCAECHNGDEAFAVKGDKKGEEEKNCKLCHVPGKDIEFQYPLSKLIKDKKLPRARLGNRVDWQKAEDEGRLELKDNLDWVKPKPFKRPKDFTLHANLNLPAIIFSHDKHAEWNGCAVCHPAIFAVDRNKSAYTMQDIFEGRACGVCHGKVSFMIQDCRRCHTEEVSY
jgi:c(7)-type cytochrome triheme protein